MLGGILGPHTVTDWTGKRGFSFLSEEIPCKIQFANQPSRNNEAHFYKSIHRVSSVKCAIYVALYASIIFGNS